MQLSAQCSNKGVWRRRKKNGVKLVSYYGQVGSLKLVSVKLVVLGW